MHECRGRGAFGSVWRAVWNGEFECAVKALTPGAWHPHYLVWCLEKLRTVERPGIVKVYSYDLSPPAPYLSMVLLPAGVVTMEEIAGRLPGKEAWSLLDSLADTLSWLHSEGSVHTGLSGNNVFAATGPDGQPMVMVSDIGQGWLTECPTQLLHHQLPYIPPEHWRAATQILKDGRGQPRDVYAFGVLAWHLLTGSWPRGGALIDGVMAAPGPLSLEPAAFADWLEDEAPSRWPGDASCPGEAARRQIIERCLSFDPAIRYRSMQEVWEELTANPLDMSAAPVRDRHPSGATAGQPAPERNTAATEPADTSEAFEKDAVLPRSRRFSLSMPRLSLKLQRHRSDDVLPGTTAGVPRRKIRLFWPAAAAAGLAGCAWLGWKNQHDATFLQEAASQLTTSSLTVKEMAAELGRARGESTELTSTLNEERTAAAAAASQLLRDTLASRPLDDSQLAGWRAAMRPVATLLSNSVDTGSDGKTTANGMQNLWLVASLKHYLDDTDDAMKLLETGHRDLEAATAAAGGRLPQELQLQAARVHSLTGAILSARLRFSEAEPHLASADSAWAPWVEAHADDRDSRRAAAENLLLYGRAILSLNRSDRDRARAILIRIPALLPDNPPGTITPPEQFILADYGTTIGNLEMAGGNATAAVSSLTEALHMMRDLDGKTDIEDPNSTGCRLRLARLYTALGKSFLKLDHAPESRDLADAEISFHESVNVYNELVGEMPRDTGIKVELAATYNHVAELMQAKQPGLPGATEALSYQERCLKFLRMINEQTPLDNSVRQHLAATIVLNGELQAATGKNAEGLNLQKEALALLEELLPDLTEGERREAHMLTARAWKATADIHEKTKRNDDAILAFGKALAAAETAATADEPPPPMVAAIKQSLQRLKPQG